MASSSCVASGGISILNDDRKRVIGELTRGREIADKLRLKLRQSSNNTIIDSSSAVVSPDAQALVGKILDSFTHSLSILCAGSAESNQDSQVPATAEDSGESCKTPASKDRRGCYKRRRTSETWKKETPTLFEDGHAWRKYGQKVILNAKHPRNYFRCTHKFDQGCQASKQVQKIQDDPPLFRTTYHGQHSCKDFLKSSSAHHIIMDAATPDHSSIIWRFGGEQANYSNPNTNGVVINSKPALIKQENKEDYQIKSSPPPPPPSTDDVDYFISNSELAGFNHHTNNSANLGAFSSGSDHGASDVYSCTASTHSMEMDMDHMMVGSVFYEDFLDEFQSLS